jgi:hypothetical protein
LERWKDKPLQSFCFLAEATPNHWLIVRPHALMHPCCMKKVVVFSDSGIFIHTVVDSPAAEKSEE